MGDLFKRPTFTRDISGIERTPEMTVGAIPNVLPANNTGTLPGGQQLEFGAETNIPGQLQPFSRQVSFQGVNPALAALADFATAFGGPRGFGSGMGIAAEQAYRRNQAPTQFFNEQQQQADIGTQRTLQTRQIERQEEQDNAPIIKIDEETGRVVVVHPRKIAAGDIVGGVKTIETLKKMTAEEAQTMIQDLEQTYGFKLSPIQVASLAAAQDNPKRFSAELSKIRAEVERDKQAEVKAAAAEAKATKDWDNRFEMQRRQAAASTAQLISRLEATGRPTEDDLQATAEEVAEGRLPIDKVPPRDRSKVVGLVRRSGGLMMSTKQVEAFQKAGQLERVVDEIERVANLVNTGKPALTPFTRAQKEASAFMGFDDNAVRLKAARMQLGPIARTISAEVGVLTDKDIGRAEVGVPQVGESAPATKAKIEQLKTWIFLAKQGIKEQAGARPQTYEITMPDGSTTRGVVTAAEGLKLQDAGAKLKKVQ